MRPYHPTLIEKCEAARYLEHPLDDKHYVWATGVILVETKRDIILQRPRQDTVLKLCYLLAIPQYDGIFTNEIDTRDMTVKIDSHERPIQSGRDLFDMR